MFNQSKRESLRIAPYQQLLRYNITKKATPSYTEFDFEKIALFRIATSLSQRLERHHLYHHLEEKKKPSNLNAKKRSH